MPKVDRTGWEGRSTLLALVFLIGACLGPNPGSAQESAGGWVFSSIPHANLWFHGMALVDPVGPGPNPLYDPGYPSEIRRTKENAGLNPTALDTRSGYFREAFRRDQAFEVLHFVPLYFHRAGRVEFFSALKLLVTTGEGIPRAQTANTAFGLAAVGSVLTTQAQRIILGEFVSALEAEWELFFGGWWREATATRGQIESSLQQVWAADYGPEMAPTLQKIGMAGGVVALVPAIGGEGRVFGGTSGNPTDNVLVVSAPNDLEHSIEAIYSMLRELSFPVVRRVMERGGRVARDQRGEESLASRAAIRSGALILEKYRPEDLPDYQGFFLTQAGRQVPAGEATEGLFKEVFPIDPGMEQALREEIFTMVTNGGVG